MDNILGLPSAIYGMTKIPIRDAMGSISRSNSSMTANIMGSIRDIDIFSDQGGGTVRATCVRHGFLTGDSVVISGTHHVGTHTSILRVDEHNFDFTDVFEGTTAAGSGASETPADIVYSPIDGLPVIKFITRSSHNNVWTFPTGETQTIFPNSVIVVKKLGFVDGSGALDTSKVLVSQLSPSLMVSEEAVASDAFLSCYYSFVGDDAGGFTDQWCACSPLRRKYTIIDPGGVPKDWCTTLENDGFTTENISIYQSSTSSDENVFYLGGILSQDVEKARIIISFNNIKESAYDNAIADMKSRGWKGQAFIQGLMHSVSPFIERVQDLYGKGWDISNHSWEHIGMNDDNTDADFYSDILKSKQWQVQAGFLRGADFIAYPNTVGRLDTDDGAGLADPFFVMGRGQGHRIQYYDGEHGASAGYSHIVPHDRMNISYQAANTGSNTDYSLSVAKTSVAETVLHKGILNQYFHDVKESPESIDVSIDWWDAFIVDIDARVAAGELEVITMTDWYNDIYGIEKVQFNRKNSGIGSTNIQGKK